MHHKKIDLYIIPHPVAKYSANQDLHILFHQMALCNSLPDWNTEEVSCVKRNKKEIHSAVEDMAEHLPKEDPGKGTLASFLLNCS